MEHSSRNQTLLRQYLMGEMSERERDDLEEKYFSDDELFGELLDAEDQIIDDYRRGQLSPRERERFEQRFLTLPDRHQEVVFTSLLAESLVERRAADLPSPNAEPPPRRKSLFDRLLAPHSIPRWSMAAAALLVALVGGWVVLNITRPQTRTASSHVGQPGSSGQAEQSEQAREERIRIEEELANLQTSAVPANTLFPVTLSRGASRGSEEIKTVTPIAETTVIEFTLDAGAENYSGYQARLQKAYDESDRIRIKRLAVKTAVAGKIVTVRLPVARLETDDYQITLEGISPPGEAKIIGKYLFKARRQ